MRAGRDLLLGALFLVLAGLSVMGSINGHKQLDFGVWFFGLGAAVLLARAAQHRARRAGVQQKASARKEPVRERVVFDERGIRREMSDGRAETIAWDEIDEIGIVTSDEGPFVDDVHWLFLNRDRSNGCAVSNAAEGFKELLERIQRLPGFDNDAVVNAMGSTSNQSFRVWQKPVAPEKREAGQLTGGREDVARGDEKRT